MAQGRRIVPAELNDKEILSAMSKSYTQTQIAEHYGVNRITVARYQRMHGVMTSKKNTIRLETILIMMLKDSGLSLKQIVEQTKISYTIVALRIRNKDKVILGGHVNTKIIVKESKKPLMGKTFGEELFLRRKNIELSENDSLQVEIKSLRKLPPRMDRKNASEYYSEKLEKVFEELA